VSNQTCLVMTTIGDGTFVERCAEAIRREALPGRICVIVIPDRKSPPSLFETCDRVKQGGIDVLCPSIEAQDAYLAKFGAIKGVIPYNSDNRRNIGFLLALEQGCDVMISVDDDNYPLPETAFLTEHLVVGQRAEAESIASDDGWFNICDLLEIEPRTTYPRGFPYSRRHQDRKTTTTREEGVVHVNAGLWLGHPDIDAVSCLYAPARSKAFKGKSVFLGQDTWSPINTQNTAIVREAIAAYYFWRMGYPLMGMPIDRDGDIFSGYCVQACARHLGYRVPIGGRQLPGSVFLPGGQNRRPGGKLFGLHLE
jgi:hypothetical protein